MAKSPYEFSYMMRKKLYSKIFFMVFFIFTLFVITTLFFSLFLFPIAVKSSSMHPEIEKNSLLFVTPLASPLVVEDDKKPSFISYMFHSVSLNRGDLVLVAPKTPYSAGFINKVTNYLIRFFTFQQYSPVTSSNLISKNSNIRRIVGFPGDTLYIKDYILYAKPLGSEHFLTEFELSKKEYSVLIEERPQNWDFDVGMSGFMDNFVLGPNEYFVLADNRMEAVDSRVWGTVAAKDIQGKAILRYWPLSHFSGL